MVVILFSIAPVNIMAASANTLNKIVTVSVNGVIDGVYLKIQPADTIYYNDYIEIMVENGAFLSQKEIDSVEDGMPVYQYCIRTGEGTKYKWDEKTLPEVNAEGALDRYDKYFKASGTAGYLRIYNEGVINENPRLPYKLEVVSPKRLGVKLYPLPVEYIGFEADAIKRKVHYYIPLPVKATNTGDVKISIDNKSTYVTGGGTYIIASVKNPKGVEVYENPISIHNKCLLDGSKSPNVVLESQYTNNTDSEITTTVLVGLFDLNEKLVESQQKTITIGPKDTYIVRSSFKYLSKSTIKSFSWGDLNNIGSNADFDAIRIN